MTVRGDWVRSPAPIPFRPLVPWVAPRLVGSGEAVRPLSAVSFVHRRERRQWERAGAGEGQWAIRWSTYNGQAVPLVRQLSRATRETWLNDGPATPDALTSARCPCQER